MVMIGAAGRNVGKTELACALLREFSRAQAIVGVKVTTIRERGGTCPRGGEGCGVCASLQGDFCLTEETGGAAGKDTVRMLAAGASRVVWLRVLRENLEAGARALVESIGTDALAVCESNSLRHEVRPGLFLVVRDGRSAHIKHSAAEVLDLADRVVAFDGNSLDLGPGDILLEGRRWALKEPPGGDPDRPRRSPDGGRSEAERVPIAADLPWTAQAGSRGEERDDSVQ